MLEIAAIVIFAILSLATAFALFPDLRRAAGRGGAAVFYGSLLLAIVTFSMLKAAVVIPIRRLTASNG